MDIFDASDGTRLAYHRAGAGSPLICVPGGPMRASAYLGDLGVENQRKPIDPDQRPDRHDRRGW